MADVSMERAHATSDSQVKIVSHAQKAFTGKRVHEYVTASVTAQAMVRARV